MLNTKEIDYKIVEEISKGLNIPKFISEVLIERGVRNAREAEKFLHPRIEDLHNPLLIPEMEKAVQRVKVAKENKERVLIWGDHDADGICATSLLVNAFKKISFPVDFFISPLDIYGMYNEKLDEFANNKIDLVITVDCGITNQKEVEYAKEKGIDVIITDHHEIITKLYPQALAVINPKRKDSSYPFKELSGCGVAFKFAQAITHQILEKELDLVALGTISDLMPLLDENRIMVKYGLEILAQTEKIGLEILLKNNRIVSPQIEDVIFLILPLINSCGRFDKSELALRFLLTNSEAEAKDLLEEMSAINKERKIIQEQQSKKVNQIFQQQVDLEKDEIIILEGEIYPSMAGIFSAQLMRKYKKPTIVLSKKGNRYIGTARSIPDFDILDAISKAGDLLNRYGGHKYACGFEVSLENKDAFIKRMKKLTVPKNIEQQNNYPEIEIDLIEDEIKELLKKLEPYGSNNPVPLFILKNVKPINWEFRDNNLYLTLSGGKFSKQLTGIVENNLTEFENILKNNQSIDVVFKFLQPFQLYIYDLMPHSRETKRKEDSKSGRP